MSENTEFEETEEPGIIDRQLAIEGKLPLKAVGIENLKEANPKHMPPHRYIHPWFARRPTPAARLAILGSVLPQGTSPDDILSLMQIGPEDMETGIAEYVEEKKATESQRSGTLGEWYGYPRPFTQSPTEAELEEFHSRLRETWDGELPTVLDSTAGGGVIPFESIRYGLPTVANELNPVASLILKVLLEYAPDVGELGEEVRVWRDKIIETAQENISQYYPTERDERQVLASACTYTVNCDSCGGKIPLVTKWWLQKRNSSSGVAIKPNYQDGDVSYECVEISKNENTEFDPANGPVSRRDVECPHCKVVTKHDDIKSKFIQDDFSYEVYGVKYDDPRGGSGFRAGGELDADAIKRAKKNIDSNFDLVTFLASPVEVSSRLSDPTTWGMEEWRDIFNPRQLVSHYEILKAYEEHSDSILEKYERKTAEAILTLLAITSSKMIDRNSRMSSWDTGKGYPNPIFVGNSFSLCRMFCDNNPCADNMGYKDISEKVIDSYDELSQMVSDRESARVRCGDAANLSSWIGEDEIEAAVVDPPYYDSVMYAELSDVFYVLQKEYLSDIHPTLYETQLTNKSEEAVASPIKFDSIDGGKSRKEMAREHYENKMSEIFSDLYESLCSGGVLTIMFTHKEMDAWDTLATSLIDSGFTITATHPITSEIPSRVGMRGSNSADSTILLTGRKTADEPSNETGESTLWDDVKEQTKYEAKNAAEELLESGLRLTKTDTIIAAFGPTLRVYAENYPVVDKKGDPVPPREALAEARDAVVQVFSERYLETDRFDSLDNLTRWYILSWLVYETDTFPFDEGRQLGMGVGVDIDEVKRETKIWGKRSGDIQLKGHSDRVQDIVRLEAGEDVSQRKYPVDPTKERFSYTIDAVHSALHVYENKGADAAWDWLTERNLKNDQRFETTVKALLEVLPPNDDMADTLLDMVSGKTGDYLDIDISTLNLNVEQDEEGPQQTGINDFE